MEKFLKLLVAFFSLFLCFNINLTNKTMNMFTLICAILILLFSVVIVIKDKRKSMKITYSVVILLVLFIMVRSLLKMV